MNVLEIKNLNLSFKTNDNCYQALYDINLTLKKGKTLALVGESGCGKTLTAMSILRLLPPTAQIDSGEIIFDGQNILNFSEKEMRNIRGKKISLIPQDPLTSLNPLYTIGNQITEIIETHTDKRGKEAEKTAIEVLDEVKIPDAKNRLKSYPHEFSGGMCQRVIIAMAIACNSEIIIADEPTTALDVTVQAQITDLLKEIQNENGTSFIFISHDFGLVKETADDAAVMYAGHIVETASVSEIFSSPKHPYTKALIKALPDMTTEKLIPIPGRPPSVKNSFTGCPFAPRCEEKIRICENTVPKPHSFKGSQIACFLYNNI